MKDETNLFASGVIKKDPFIFIKKNNYRNLTFLPVIYKSITDT